MSKYIDGSGLTYLWSKIKAYIQSLNYTSNIGTITGITMNGSSKGTSGVVDLGTVITDISTKQDILTSGTNIKTINNQSILGSGDIAVSTITFRQW